uniref:Activin types I and II receptor domain-containing protein n=1 Tax=Parascaris univalens TaxID=6257 RepID=A0A915BP12_PARUN
MNALHFGVIFTVYLPIGDAIIDCVIGVEHFFVGKRKANVSCRNGRFCANVTLWQGHYAEDYSFSQDCGDSPAIKMGITKGPLCEQTGCREVLDGEPGFLGTHAIICCCNTLFCNDKAGKHIGLHSMDVRGMRQFMGITYW